MECCSKYLGIAVGITSILHTWSQKGKHYPHMHLLVTGGGIDRLGKWKDSELVSQEIIQSRFKKRMIEAVQKLRLDFYGAYSYLHQYDNYMRHLEKVKKSVFGCYKKEPYHHVMDIYEYFGKYAFRVCITDDRIKKIENKYVYFTYRNYSNKNEEKISRGKGGKIISKILLLKKMLHGKDITKSIPTHGEEDYA